MIPVLDLSALILENRLFPSENPNPPPDPCRIPGALEGIARDGGQGGKGQHGLAGLQELSEDFWDVERAWHHFPDEFLGPLALLEFL